jgi:hypothetical protein
MKRLRARLTYANVMATIAVFIALGGASYAAFKLPKNSVGTKQLKKNAVTTAKIKKKAVTAAKVKNGTLTGTQINLSKLGTVPSADIAQTAKIANSVAPSEAWHELGAPGEPKLLNNWKNGAGSASTAAFYKDHEGIVHLKGFVEGGTAALIFELPPGYRPPAGKLLSFAVNCNGGFCANSVGVAQVFGTGFSEPGGVVVPAKNASLNGIDFRAES